MSPGRFNMHAGPGTFLQSLKHNAILLGHCEQLRELVGGHLCFNLEAQTDLVEPDGTAGSTPSVPRKSTSPSAETAADPIGMSRTVAAAFNETPAQAIRASSRMSPEH